MMIVRAGRVNDRAVLCVIRYMMYRKSHSLRSYIGAQRLMYAVAGIFTTALIVCGLLSAMPAYATKYGSDKYGACEYQICPDSTHVPVPGSTLDIDVNLSNGEVVNGNGFTIVVTPLNGEGDSIQKADFYVNGDLAQTRSPDNDGSVRWHWVPGNISAATIKVTVTTTSGQVISRDFDITIRTLSNVTVTVKPSLLQSIERTIRSLPPLIKYLLPYFLFLILLIDILLLLYHIRRELKELQRLRELAEREHLIAAMKDTFMALISHYLRTPLSVLSGGVDLLASLHTYPDSLISGLQHDLKGLQSAIEGLISRSSSRIQSSPPAESLHAPAIWRQPLLIIPVILVGVAAFSFDYLAEHAGDFSLHQINLIIQVVVYSSLAVGAYLAMRQFHLYRQTLAAARHVVDEEVAFNRTRDEFIHEAGDELTQALHSIDSRIAQVGESSATKFMKQGQQQLREISAKFIVAQKLQGSSSTAPITHESLSAILAPALSAVQEKAEAKSVRIDTPPDAYITVQDPSLVTVVAKTVLDNAVSYSAQSGEVAVTAETDGNTLVLAVADQGKGIDESKRSALFQAFNRAEGVEVFDHEGMGFSLYLDRIIMYYLHGDIAVEPVTPHGTLVRLTLPLGPKTGV